MARGDALSVGIAAMKSLQQQPGFSNHPQTTHSVCVCVCV